MGLWGDIPEGRWGWGGAEALRPRPERGGRAALSTRSPGGEDRRRKRGRCGPGQRGCGGVGAGPMASSNSIDIEDATQHLRDILKLDRPGGEARARPPPPPGGERPRPPPGSPAGSSGHRPPGSAAPLGPPGPAPAARFPPGASLQAPQRPPRVPGLPAVAPLSRVFVWWPSPELAAS